MNSRERAKRNRIEILKQLLGKDPKAETENLVNILIVNFAVSKKTALEEVTAVRGFLECQTNFTNEEKTKRAE